jgi:hypothetical protein
MTGSCDYRNPLTRDGLSQDQRLVETLKTDYVSVDEKSFEDLLVFAFNYASEVLFYEEKDVINLETALKNEEDRPAIAANWKALFSTNPAVNIALISNTNTTTIQRDFKTIYNNTQTNPTVANLTEIFEYIRDLALKIDAWKLQSVEGSKMEEDVITIISSSLEEALEELVAYDLGASKLSGVQSIGLQYKFSTVWNLSYSTVVPDTSIYEDGSNNEERIKNALSTLEEVFFEFVQAAVLIKSFAESHLKELLENWPYHQPHMALFLAFLELYKKAQNHINTITERHLEYFYKEVLQFEELDAEPDKVHVLFELAKKLTATSYAVKKDTALRAGKDDTGVERHYNIDKEIAVSIASVDSMKSVFQEINTADAITNIYKASKANSADGEGEELDEDEPKWKAFGSDDLKTADVGFAVASPILLLKEGERYIELEFTLQKKSNFRNGADLAEVEAELKTNLKVQYSGEKKWIDSKIAYVNITDPSADDTSQNVTVALVIKIDQSEKPFVAYDSTVLDGKFDTDYPLLKITCKGDGAAIKGFGIDEYHFTQEATYPLEQLILYNGVIYQKKSIAIFATIVTDIYTKYSLPDNWKEIGSITDLLEAKETIYKAGNYTLGAIVVHNDEIYRAKVDGALPAPFATSAQWELIPESTSNPYKYFHPLSILSQKITVSADEMKGLVLQNDQSILDANKPFMPFGPIPNVGGEFFMGSTEVFLKDIKSLDINLEWDNAPANFSDHYGAYCNDVSCTGDAFRDNEDFTATVSFLNGREWITLSKPADASSDLEIELFDRINAQTKNEISLTDLSDLDEMKRATEIDEVTELTNQTSRGFMKLQLNAVDFGHKDYPNFYIKKVIQLDTISTIELPKEPYIPTIKSLSIDYVSEQTTDYSKLTDDDFEDRVEQLFHLHPFGHVEVYPIKVGAVSDDADEDLVVNRYLIPHFEVTDTITKTAVDAEGTFYIGVDDLKPPQNLSVLFQVAEGSGDPEKAKQEVIWSYLSNNQWVDFEVDEILSETTNDLLTSGIVEFKIPKAANNDNTLLTGELTWLKAAIKQDSDAVCQLIDVHPQAVAATFKDDKNDPNHLKKALPAKSITKLKESDSSIKGVSQPYASIKGKMAEEGEDFYIRVSETLKHKDRASTIDDIERHVLAFESGVFKVKCLNHTHYDKTTGKLSELAPGYVTVVVIPDLTNKNAVNPLEPKVSLNTIDEIQEYLETVTTMFLKGKVIVKNPDYEEIKVEFDVEFHADYDDGLYKDQLNKDIQKYLSPWAFDSSDAKNSAFQRPIGFVDKIYSSDIINFIEERFYVDYIKDFKMFQKVDGAFTVNEIQEAVPSNSGAILVSTETHKINTENVSCAV